MNSKHKKKLFIVSALSICIALVCIGCCMAQNDDPQLPPSIDLEALEKVKIPSDVPSVKKEYTGFKVDFNPSNHTPNVVSWSLLAQEASGDAARSNYFWKDPEIEGCPEHKDYTGSGFDRGHMCPAADQKWSEKAMTDCFVMANMCPQQHSLNAGAWQTLEEKERQWAIRDKAIVIAAGPIYSDEDTQTIGNIKVRVPSAFFKVMLAPYSTPMRAIGFIYPNMTAPGNMENYSTTVDEVEKITGFDFFSDLPDDVENDIESSASFKEWNNYR